MVICSSPTIFNASKTTFLTVTIRAAASGDAFGGDGFSDDIHDQLCKVEQFADYGYRNTNWQNNSQATGAGFFAANQRQGVAHLRQLGHAQYQRCRHRAASSDPPHNPANPDGLGPHSSSNGLDFFYDVGGSSDFDGLAFVARWNSTVNRWRPVADIPGRRECRRDDRRCFSRFIRRQSTVGYSRRWFGKLTDRGIQRRYSARDTKRSGR